MFTHYAARWRQTCTFFKIDYFMRHSLTHGTTQDHHIFTFAKKTGVLVDYQDLPRSLYNWGRYCALNFEKSQKIVKVWGPLTRVTGKNSKKWIAKSF